MEIAAFKVKSCNLPISTFVHSNFNILSYKSLIDANSIFMASRLKDLSNIQSLGQNDVIWRRYEFYKIKLNSANLRKDYFVK